MDQRVIQLLIDSFGQILLPGLTMTIPLTVISFSLAMVIAIITALVQFANIRVLKQIARFYIWVVRGTPLLVQLFVVFYGLPDIGIVLDPFPAAIIVFSINEGAYCAETMRAALEAVPAGQMEAGYCVGMSYLQIIRRIVLPQALRTAFPPLSNSLISMVKDTSLAANITVMEMFMATQRIAARTYEMLPLYCEVAADLPAVFNGPDLHCSGQGKGGFLPMANGTASEKRECLLRVDNIRKAFGDQTVLQDVSLEVDTGRRDRHFGPQRVGQDHAAAVPEFPRTGGRRNADLRRGDL